MHDENDAQPENIPPPEHPTPLENTSIAATHSHPPSPSASTPTPLCSFQDVDGNTFLHLLLLPPASARAPHLPPASVRLDPSILAATAALLLRPSHAHAAGGKQAPHFEPSPVLPAPLEHYSSSDSDSDEDSFSEDDEIEDSLPPPVPLLSPSLEFSALDLSSPALASTLSDCLARIPPDDLRAICAVSNANHQTVHDLLQLYPNHELSSYLLSI